MAEGPSPGFKVFRFLVGMLSSLLVPVAFGLCMNFVPPWVVVFMCVAAGFHLGDFLLSMWVREKYPPQPPQVKVDFKIFEGEEGRSLQEFLHDMAEKKQRKETPN